VAVSGGGSATEAAVEGIGPVRVALEREIGLVGHVARKQQAVLVVFIALAPATVGVLVGPSDATGSIGVVVVLEAQIGALLSSVRLGLRATGRFPAIAPGACVALGVDGDVLAIVAGLTVLLVHDACTGDVLSGAAGDRLLLAVMARVAVQAVVVDLTVARVNRSHEVATSLAHGLDLDRAVARFDGASGRGREANGALETLVAVLVCTNATRGALV
jgi:hypothetical protein